MWIIHKLVTLPYKIWWPPRSVKKPVERDIGLDIFVSVK